MHHKKLAGVDVLDAVTERKIMLPLPLLEVTHDSARAALGMTSKIDCNLQLPWRRRDGTCITSTNQQVCALSAQVLIKGC